MNKQGSRQIKEEKQEKIQIVKQSEDTDNTEIDTPQLGKKKRRRKSQSIA